jgi:1-acyl-sn-glycerol-3-phosphate acyltransferase
MCSIAWSTRCEVAVADWKQRAWIEFVRSTCQVANTLLLSSRVEGVGRIPRKGPVLVIANHESYLDPMLIGTASPRHLTYLARKTLFRNPLFGGLLSSLGSVPIDQEGSGLGGLKTAITELENGGAVLIFPEGNRSPDGNLQALMPGVVLLLTRVKCPVLPVGVAGAYEALPVWRNVLYPSPLVPPVPRPGVALSFGELVPAERFAGLKRPELLSVLSEEMAKAAAAAERLRQRQRARHVPASGGR